MNTSSATRSALTPDDERRIREAMPAAGTLGKMWLTSTIVRLLATLDEERAAAAAYVHDRSAQYTDKSSAKCALEDVAIALLKGEHIIAAQHGELDDMMAHHKTVKR